MRTVLVNLLATCSSFVTLLAGQLDVAVIQFPEPKSLAEVESAFATVNLFGAGPLSAGSPRVQSFRHMRGHSPNLVKDQTKMQSFFLTTVGIAQYAP